MLSGVLQEVARVTGEMSLAAVRGRAGRTQLQSWAIRLRQAAQDLEKAARGH